MIVEQINNLDGNKFEEFCALKCQNNGCQSVTIKKIFKLINLEMEHFTTRFFSKLVEFSGKRPIG